MSKKSLDLTALDKLILYVSPEAFNRRMLARVRSEILQVRQYDAAKMNPQNVIQGNSRSANSEISAAIAPIRNNVRELVRNAPFARRGIEVIVNGVVGWGIEASIYHPDEARLRKIKDLWKEWAVDGLCSMDGKTNFAGQQKEAMGAIVGDGEILVQEVIRGNSVRQNLLEADYLCGGSLKEKIPAGYQYVNGIVQDKFGLPLYYNLYDWHPGDGGKVPTRRLVSAEEIDLAFRRDRPGQNRGVSWFAPVVQPLNLLAELQWTQLLKMKLASAITAVVTQPNSNLSPALQQAQREADWSLNAGDVRFLNNGESIEFPDIPNGEGFGPATMLALREISAGIGVTYESLSNDVTGTNFTSYKAGDIPFRANVEQWRWHMIIPYFCDPSFKRFKKFCAFRGVDASKASVMWTPPVRQFIDAAAEVAAIKASVRAGLQTYPDAVRELGRDFESHVQEIAASNKRLDELGIILDCDPRRISNEQLQSPDSLSALNNKSKSETDSKK